MSSERDAQMRALMKQARKEKEKEKDQVIKGTLAALAKSKNKEQVLEMLRQKLEHKKAAAGAPSATAPSVAKPPPAVPMAPPPPKPAPAMLPPAPRPSPPAPVAPPPPAPKATSLPGIMAGDSDEEEEEEEEEQRGAATSQPPPADLPPGFFDEEPAPLEPTTTTTSAARQEEEEEVEEEAQPPGALPVGFFDDPEADAIARNVDLKAKKEQDDKEAWSEFQKFMSEVTAGEKEQELDEETLLEVLEDQERLEQMYYEVRLAGLLAKSDKVKGEPSTTIASTSRKRGHEEDGGSAPAIAVDEVSAPEDLPTLPKADDSAASEISGLLKQKKKKRKTAVQEANEGDYIPLDPLDWRSKLLG